MRGFSAKADVEAALRNSMIDFAESVGRAQSHRSRIRSNRPEEV